MNKWIYPAIGDLPLAYVDNLTVKPLVEKMSAASLSPRTVNKYVEYIKQVVKSLKAPNGEPVHKRTWDAETMDLPIVNHSEQKRPSLKAKAISKLITDSTGQEQELFVLLAATGMRISEALGLEVRHIVNDGRTIRVEQQVKKDRPRIVKYLKTDASKREIGLEILHDSRTVLFDLLLDPDGTAIVEQQVKKDRPRIVKYLKTDASKREIDLHPDVAEY